MLMCVFKLTVFFFFVFKAGFNEKIVIKKHYRRLTIIVVKETLKRDIQ